MSQSELNPELEQTITKLLPGIDPGLVRGMLRIYYARVKCGFYRGSGHWELHQNPEGRFSEVPRFVIVKVI